MEPTFYKADTDSATGYYYHKPDELISFYDLLFRWPTVSFFTIPYFVVSRIKDGVPGFYLHLYKADSVVFQKKLSAKQTDAESMRIKLAWVPPSYFGSHYTLLYEEFDLLYFLRAEVEEIERANPECLVTDADVRKQDYLYETSTRNIRKVAALTLYRMAICDTEPVEEPHSFRDGLRNPDFPAFWQKQNAPAQTYYPDIYQDLLGADIVMPLPERAKKKRDNKLEDYKPVIKVLRNMGVRVDKKCAKILYSLYPHLTQEEIGKLFPAKSGTKRSNATDRERGRVLLGLKPSSKPPKEKDKPTAKQTKPTT